MESPAECLRRAEQAESIARLISFLPHRKLFLDDARVWRERAASATRPADPKAR